MLRVLLNWLFPFQPWKNIWRWHQEDECVEHCSISRFLQSHPKGKSGPPFSRQHVETQCCRQGDWANIGCGLCGTPSAQEWYGAYNDVVVTGFVVQCGNSPEHYELPMEKKVPWNGAVSMRSRAGSWETLSICITLRHNQGAPADMHANALGIIIICRFPLA